MANVGYDATRGITAKNKGGTHGGINPKGAPLGMDAPAKGSSGNPGTQLPWEGADATPKSDSLPPLKSL